MLRARIIWTIAYVFTMSCLSFGSFTVKNLQVEYQREPIGIDIAIPAFSWQMHAIGAERGHKQTSFAVIVTDENGMEVWSSGKILSDIAHGIKYAGKMLEPETRYHWEVAVWNQKQEKQTASSWFETGLMCKKDTDSQWSGARWIGTKDQDVVLYSHYLSVFKVEYTLQLNQSTDSKRAAFVLGANDTRLMHRDLNLMNLENDVNEAYLSFELDISEIQDNSTGKARLNIYRVGYHKDDDPDIPFRSFEISSNLINQANQFERHRFFIDCNFGLFDVYLDQKILQNKISQDDPTEGPFASKGMNLNPIGRGNNFISYPMLADIGFHIRNKQKADFSEVTIRHFRFPSNPIFQEELVDDATYTGIFKQAIKEGTLHVSSGTYQVSGTTGTNLIIADPSHDATPMLRKEFTTEKNVKKARIYVTARGIYELYLNGNRIGQDYFNPGLTQYNKNHFYQTYDVTNLIRENTSNALGAWLGEGWWSGNITYSGENWNYFGDRQSFLCKMVLTYEDDTKKIITTGSEGWKYFSEGPLRYGSFFQGEVYDATQEVKIKGWDTPGFLDHEWSPVEIIPLEGTAYLGTFTNARGNTETFEYHEMELTAQIGENASIAKELQPISVEEIRPGVFIYDLGQNIVGFPQIKITKGVKGKKIFLRYAEVKYPDLPEYQENKGMIMLENIRAALTQDIYILKGGDEIIQPRFTFHGFRFLEITGIEEAIPLENIKGLVVSSIQELTADYETSNPLVNKLWENITWSLRGNFLSIPTDTPARNERMGWSGDINVFSRAATFLAQVNQFLKRHLIAMRDIQRPDGRFTDVAPVGGGFGGTLWGSAGIIVAWETFLQYGDTTILKEHYPAMKKYMDFLNSKIDPENGVLNEGPLGDWLSPEGNKNDNTLFWTAYHAYDLEIMSKVANILNQPEDARHFINQHEERKDFFNKTYVDPVNFKTIKSGVKSGFMGPPGATASDAGTEKGKLVDTQASYAIPLAFDLFHEKAKTSVVRNLAETIMRRNTDDSGVQRPEYSLMTGFIGTASLCQALSDNGLDTLAYRLLQQTSYPSWLYSVVNGATTIWERLNSYTIENGFGGNNSMNSFNHYSFGAVAAWMLNYSLGIQRSSNQSALKELILNPRPDPDQKMKWAKGWVETVYGKISAGWEWEKDQLLYNVMIPANTSVRLSLPGERQNITESGVTLDQTEHISILNMDQNSTVLILESGHYQFKVRKDVP